MMFQKSKLSEFFEENTLTTGEHILFIDIHNLVYRTLAIASMKVPDDLEFNYWKHLFVNNIFSSIRQFEPSKVIFAFDGRKLWRKDIYKQYKEGRKEARDKSTIDFASFWKVLDTFMPDMRNSFSNMYFLKMDECEADDIIAILTKEKFKNSEKVTIISTDKDFIQLLNMRNVNLYNPIKKANVQSINPVKDLQIKILMGDKSDNIPSVRKGTGPKKALSIIQEGLDNYLDSCEDVKKAYERNRSIIDFNLIPQRIKDVVLGGYDGYNITDYNGTKMWQFLLKNNLAKLADDLNHFGPFVRRIK